MTQKNLVVFNDGSHGHWFASVLNTENGINWTDKFKKKNPHLSVRKRFRHSNRRLALSLVGKKYISYTQNEAPAKTAERFVLYLTKK